MGLLSNRTVRSSLKPGDSDGDYGLRFNPPLPPSLSRAPIRTNGASNGSVVIKLSYPSPKISRSSSDAQNGGEDGGGEDKAAQVAKTEVARIKLREVVIRHR